MSFTDTELDANYSTTDPTVGILINSGDRTSRNSQNLLPSTSITTIVATLKTKKVVPQPTDIGYETKVQDFISNINKEYTFYYDRYKYILNVLFTNIRSGYNTSTNNVTADLSQTITANLAKVNTLNTKLNDLIQIIRGITDNMNSTSTSMDANVNALNVKMATNQQNLLKQNNIIKSNQATVKIRKEMVKFTEEKARYNDNLLKMYSFLNIIALGLLFYIYRAAE